MKTLALLLVVQRVVSSISLMALPMVARKENEKVDKSACSLAVTLVAKMVVVRIVRSGAVVETREHRLDRGKAV